MKDAPIRSRANPLIRRLRKLIGGAGAEGSLLIEGVRLLVVALAAGLCVREVAASARAAEGSSRSRRLLDRLAERSAPVHLVEHALLESLSELETSEGILAIADRPRFDEE